MTQENPWKKAIPASTTASSDEKSPTKSQLPIPVPDTINNHAIGKLAYRQPSMMISGEQRKSDGFVWDDDLKNVRFLVVEDSFPILKMTSASLHEHGASITQARDGQEAVSLCESAVASGGQDFSVILTDIRMPNLDGMGVARRVRALEKELGLESKIIFGISAYFGDHLADKAMEAGMDAFLPKPFQYGKFMEVFNDIVHRRKNIATHMSDVNVVDKPIQQPIVVPAGSRILPQVK